jgi:hypothetical protein
VELLDAARLMQRGTGSRPTTESLATLTLDTAIRISPYLAGFRIDVNDLNVMVLSELVHYGVTASSARRTWIFCPEDGYDIIFLKAIF